MKKILIPLASYGSDPSEVAIPWKLFSENNIAIVFATPDGQSAVLDKRMLTGERLGLLKSSLAARRDAVEASYMMMKTTEFQQPITYDNINSTEFDGIYLPGGHDKKIKPYLESNCLQQQIVEFFKYHKLVAAVCHGVVLVARSIDPATNRSVIFDYKTTALLKKQERLAYHLTRLWLGDYYLTYPNITVEKEVTQVLKDKKQFIHGPLPLFRDHNNNLASGFVVSDRNYLSARWPGDIYNLSTAFIREID